jgi:hypothetical protein
MWEHLAISEPASVESAASSDVIEPDVVKKARPTTEQLAKQFADGMFTIVLAIALAGAAYPVVVSTGVAIFAVIELLTSRDDPRVLVRGLEVLFFGCTAGAAMGLMWASLVSIAVLPFVYFFVRSLGMRGGIVRLAAFSGGLVGFVAVMPLFLIVLFELHQNWWQTATAALAGPALTTVIGQVGGACGGRRVGWYEEAVARAAIGKGGQPAAASVGDSNDPGSPSPVRLIRLSGFDFSFALGLLLTWAVYQTVTLSLASMLGRRIGRWRVRRQSRST